MNKREKKEAACNGQPADGRSGAGWGGVTAGQRDETVQAREIKRECKKAGEARQNSE
jgi:hypothetical protein